MSFYAQILFAFLNSFLSVQCCKLRHCSRARPSPRATSSRRPASSVLLRKVAIKEAQKGFFGCYSVCETMKDTKEG